MSTEKKSQASIDDAWERRSSFQVGPLVGDRHRAGGDARTPRSMGLGPSAANQVPVPAEQGFRLYEEHASTLAAEQPAQPCQERR